MKLRNQIILFGIGTLVVILVLIQLLFTFLINKNYRETSHNKLQNGFLILERMLKEREDNLLAGCRFFTVDKHMQASVSMIDTYQDIKNYRPLIFDEEKKKIAARLKDYAANKDLYLVAVYDSNKNLASFCTINRNGNFISGYNSFFEGQPIIFTKLKEQTFLKTEEELPMLYAVPSSEMAQAITLHYHATSVGFVIEATAPLFRKFSGGQKRLIGFVKMVNRIDREFLNTIAMQSGLEVNLLSASQVLSTGQKVLSVTGIPEFLPVLSFKPGKWYGMEIPSVDNIVYGARFLLTEGTYTTVLFGVNLGRMQQGISVLRNTIFLAFGGFLLLFVPIATWFMHRTITNPVADLISGMNAFSKGIWHPLKEKKIAAEFSSLAHSFNDMAKIINQNAIERNLAKDTLQKTNERLELVVNGANLGTWDWNIESGEVIFNKRWAEIIGYSMEELEPDISTWKKILHPEEKKEIMHILTDHLEGHTSVYVTEHRLKHKSGKWVWVLDVGKVFELDDQGNPIRAVGIHLDITDQKHAEQQLIMAKELAETANYAKSVFLANMSHELRTPLNAILGYTQIFADDTTLSPKQQSGIKTMHQSGKHLLMLINDILDLSKIESGKMELVMTTFRLPEFFQGIADIIKVRTTAKELDFFYEPAAYLPDIIEADDLRLRQVILNLLSNAVKFTEKGHCTLRVQSKAVNEDKARLTVTVEDSGPGIALEMQNKIFVPFQQTGERLKYSEGSGLGLSICRKLVGLMDGELQVISPINWQPEQGEGGGSRFSFSIKVSVLNNTAIPSTEKRHVVTGYSISENGQKKILIVDDKPSNRAVLRDMLEPLNFLIDEATDGSEVLKACQEFNPDAVLMDLHMPEMDGFSATEQLKQHPDFQEIVVIAVTATPPSTEGLQFDGFDGYIVKPFTVIDLLEIMAGLLSITLTYSEEYPLEEQDKEIVWPPEKNLEELRTLIRNGDITGISRKVDSLAVEDFGKYKLFAAKIAQFSEDFQLSRIEQFIEKKKRTIKY